MNKDKVIGFVGTPDTMVKYYERCAEAEKVMGSLSEDERITILKSLAEPITFQELVDMMAGKRVLNIVHDKKESA